VLVGATVGVGGAAGAAVITTVTGRTAGSPGRRSAATWCRLLGPWSVSSHCVFSVSQCSASHSMGTV